jgi:hypothetical protein
MTFRNDCRIRKGRRTIGRRALGDHELGRTLDEYEGFVRSKAWQYTRRYDDLQDFQQVGREAVVKVFEAIEGGLRVRSEKGYYLNSIQNAMLDYYRMQYRRNYEVWVYDKKNGPTRVKRYRYGGEWKARIQYHGDKLKRVVLGHRAVLRYEEYFSYDG